MANAVVDLPDPLAPQPATRAGAGTGAGADDLLSEMVGDEIDRLLAEADAKPTTQPSERLVAGAAPAAEPEAPRAFDLSSIDQKPLPTAKSDADASSPTLAQELDEILSSVDSLIESVDAADEPDGAIAADDQDAAPTIAEAAEMDKQPEAATAASAVVENKTSAAAAAAKPQLAEPPAAEPAFEIDEHAMAGPEASAAHDEFDGSTGAMCELPPLELPTEAAPADAAPPTEVAAPPSLDSRFADTLLVRVLQWINKPFEACPAALRDALGKAAVATLINAAAILLYIRWIHHRH